MHVAGTKAARGTLRLSRGRVRGTLGGKRIATNLGPVEGSAAALPLRIATPWSVRTHAETGAPVDGQPNGSYRNIERAGFEPQYVRANYLAAIAAS